MNDDSSSKGRIADLYNPVASSYGQVGPRTFERFGKRLVELLDLSQITRILDVATGRGASLLPAAQVMSPQIVAIGIDLAAAMLTETRSETLSVFSQPNGFRSSQAGVYYSSSHECGICGNQSRK